MQQQSRRTSRPPGARHACSLPTLLASALAETNRRRKKQIAYNRAHGITPETIRKNVADVLDGLFNADTDMARVELAVSDDPLARQSAVEAEVEASVQPRSKAGRGGTRSSKGKSRGKMR